jgi:hypothetical protein
VKLNDADAEAAEPQPWLDFAVVCGYVEADIARELSREYDHIIGKIVNLFANPSPWLMPTWM